MKSTYNVEFAGNQIESKEVIARAKKVWVDAGNKNRKVKDLKTIKTNRVIKGTTLVGAFYIFSLAFYSYLFHILFAWIFLLLSIGFAAIGLSVEKLQKVIMRAIINKEKQKMNNERKYVFSKEGVDIVTQAGATGMLPFR